MTQVLQPISDIAARAASDVSGHSNRLLRLLEFVPGDKLAWSPVPSSRSPLAIAVHCAATNTFFADVLSGRLDAMPSPDEFFRGLKEAESKITTREEAVVYLKESTADLVQVLGSITAEAVNQTVSSPFGFLPALFWIGQSVEHMAYHTGQIAYLQTIWGDMDEHMG